MTTRRNFLSQGGDVRSDWFVAIAPNIYSLQKDATTLEQSRKLLAEKTTMNV